MGCLDNLISIKSCTDVVGSSPYYIEDIGITLSEADYYINNEVASGQELIEDRISFATKLVSDLIANHFASSIITKSLLDSDVLGQYQDSLNLKNGVTGVLGGISLTLNNTQSYFNVFVNSISLQVDVSGTVDVLIYDLISGQLLDTIEVTTVANQISTAIVNKTYGSYKRKLDLVFVYDTEGVNSNTTQISNGCGSCNGYKYSNFYVTANSISMLSANAKIRSSVTSSSHTFGLSVNYSIQCSLDKWLCEIANLMALPILYKSGEEIMNYALLYSKRQTSEVNIDAETNLKRKEEYAAKFNEALQATVQKIQLPQNDKCFICSAASKMVIVLP